MVFSTDYWVGGHHAKIGQKCYWLYGTVFMGNLTFRHRQGAHPYKRDLKNIELHILDTGHFALEEDLDFIATHIRDFVDRNPGK